MATEALLTGWPREAAAWAARKCFEAWLAERGTAGAREDAQAIRQLRGFIERHKASRFDIWAKATRAEGERQASDDDDARNQIATPPAERFRTQHCAGFRRWEENLSDDPDRDRIPDGRRVNGYRFYHCCPVR